MNKDCRPSITRFAVACVGLLVAASCARRSAEPPQPAQVVLPKPSVTWIKSPNYDARPHPDGVTAIVIHDTETPGISRARTIANHFANPASEVSAHFIIGKAGEIVQCVAEEQRAWHAGPSRLDGQPKVNDFSIGIELVNAEDNLDPFTDAQYRSLTTLSAYLVSRYRIPVSRIVGHRDVSVILGLKRDPADNFAWDRYRHDLAARLARSGVTLAKAAGP